MVETIDAVAADALSVGRSVVALLAAYPTAQIRTEQVTADREHALFRCTIALASGAMATGYGHERRGTSADFYEVAEGRAMERACAMLGYAIDGLADPCDRIPGASVQ